MTEKRFDVLTIGNAIIDIIAPVPEGFIAAEGLSEGIMHLVDLTRSDELYAKMPPSKQQSPGGSAANTAVGIASLGGRAACAGKIADDEMGDLFARDLETIGVHYTTSRLVGGAATARSMILVSPNGERTMNTYLGACHELTGADIIENDIGAAVITYMDGFLWDPREARKAFVKAAHFAHKHERAAAFTLADPLCVDRHREEFLDLIRSKTMDYVFANVHELKALYQTDDLGEAVRAIAEDAELAAITLGSDGAMAIANGEIVSVPAFPVDKLEDATGAGDLFAAGFLLSIARDQPLEQALRLGCLAAAEIISHVGARPHIGLADLARRHGLMD